MIPRVEEVCSKTQGLPLSDLKGFEKREIPVLLAWTAVSVATEASESSRAEIGIRKDCRISLSGIALRGIEKRSGGEGGGIQISVNPRADASVTQTARKGCTVGETGGFHPWSRAKAEESATPHRNRAQRTGNRTVPL